MGLVFLPFLAFVRDVSNFGSSSGNHFLSFIQTRIDQAGLQGRLMARASEPVFAPAVTMLLRALHDRDEREPVSAARPTNARTRHPVAFQPILLPHQLQIARA